MTARSYSLTTLTVRRRERGEGGEDEEEAGEEIRQTANMPADLSTVMRQAHTPGPPPDTSSAQRNANLAECNIPECGKRSGICGQYCCLSFRK